MAALPPDCIEHFRLVREMITDGQSYDTIAEAVGCSLSYVNNVAAEEDFLVAAEVQAADRAAGKPIKVSATASGASGPSSMHVDAAEPSGRRPKFVPLTDALRKQLRADGACFYCRKVAGHIAEDCPLLKAAKERAAVRKGKRPISEV